MDGSRTARIRWLDAAKGLGILLVVVGHVADEHGALANVIYHFHMPMFFILSGIVYRPEPVVAQLVRRARSLLVPYFAFLVILTIMRIAVESFDGLSLPAIGRNELHQGELNLVGGRYSVGDYGTLWFVTSLFLALSAYNMLRAVIASPVGWPMVAVMAALLALSYPIARLSLPWDASVVPMAMVFIWVGDAGSSILRGGVPRAAGAARGAWIAAAAAGLGLAGLLWCAPLDMKLGDFGTPVGSAVAAVALSYLFFLASRRVVRLPVVSGAAVQLGQATLVILFLHRFFVLHLQGALPGIVVAVVATAIPFAAWLVFRQMPSPVRQILLGERPPVPRETR